MMGQRPQQCFMTPLLVGTDGSQKMSKSLGNYIGVDEPPADIYGKTMSVPDELIMQYFELVTDVSDEELEEFRKQLRNETVNPMILKKRLGKELVTQLYSEKEAAEAEEHFERVVQKGEVPEEIQEIDIEEILISFKDLSPQQMETTGVYLPRLLVIIRLAKSMSDATRLISQGAVNIDGEKIFGNSARIKIGSIIKVGKRRFARVINTDRIK